MALAHNAMTDTVLTALPIPSPSPTNAARSSAQLTALLQTVLTNSPVHNAMPDLWARTATNHAPKDTRVMIALQKSHVCQTAHLVDACPTHCAVSVSSHMTTVPTVSASAHRDTRAPPAHFNPSVDPTVRLANVSLFPDPVGNAYSDGMAIIAIRNALLVHTARTASTYSNAVPIASLDFVHQQPHVPSVSTDTMASTVRLNAPQVSTERAARNNLRAAPNTVIRRHALVGRLVRRACRDSMAPLAAMYAKWDALVHRA